MEPHYFLPRIVDDDGCDAFLGTPVADIEAQLVKEQCEAITRNFIESKKTIRKWYESLLAGLPLVILSTPPTHEQVVLFQQVVQIRTGFMQMCSRSIENLRQAKNKMLQPYLNINK